MSSSSTSAVGKCRSFSKNLGTVQISHDMHHGGIIGYGFVGATKKLDCHLIFQFSQLSDKAWEPHLFCGY
jgi:hypothetical protein